MATFKKLTEGKVMKALDWAYEKSVYGGIPGLSTAEELANDFAHIKNSTNRANSLIRWQNAKGATSGFVTGLGGIFTLPVSIPANITTVLYIQVRMIAAIAHIGGHDIKSDRVKTLVYICLVGSAATDVLKDVGIAVGRKFTEKAIENISRDTIVKINQRVGFRLLTKFGEKGVVNLVKFLPLVGGVIGGTIDAVATNTIGNVARNTFIKSRKSRKATKATKRRAKAI